MAPMTAKVIVAGSGVSAGLPPVVDSTGGSIGGSTVSTGLSIGPGLLVCGGITTGGGGTTGSSGVEFTGPVGVAGSLGPVEVSGGVLVLSIGFPVPPDGTLGAGTVGMGTGGFAGPVVHGTGFALTVTDEPSGNVVLLETVEPSVPSVVMIMVMVACVEAAARGAPSRSNVGIANKAAKAPKRVIAGSFLSTCARCGAKFRPGRGNVAIRPRHGMRPARGWNHNPAASPVNAECHDLSKNGGIPPNRP